MGEPPVPPPRLHILPDVRLLLHVTGLRVRLGDKSFD